tara:strand:- start:1013 stop:1168 length:156 start_codon:yes stop_codon:yes gene_type:complete
MNNQNKIVKKQLDKIREQSRRKRLVEKQAPQMLFGVGIVLMLLFAISLIIK